MKYKTFDATAVASETTVWDPVVNHKFILQGGVIAGSVTGNYVFRDGTAGTTILILPLTADVPLAFTLDERITSATVDALLTCDGPPASTLSGTLWGDELYVDPTP